MSSQRCFPFLSRTRIRCVPAVPWLRKPFLSSSRRAASSLHVLFCGSDDFSIRSLESLHEYSQSPGSNIGSIRVACKNDHRTGRGLAKITSPPILHRAKQLGLPYHQFDTFRGWNLPTHEDGTSAINMVIAVSFGLLVPPRILNVCQFGGLNVHPSLLPDLKGSAPIEHSILYGDRMTGVTVQTLHPSKFDEGQILVQTQPALPIPDADSITAQSLKDYLAPIGADLLVQAIRENRYLLRDGDFARPITTETRAAPKIRKDDARIAFTSMTSTAILRRNRAIGGLWAALHGDTQDTSNARLILGPEISRINSTELNAPPEAIKDLHPGDGFVVTSKATPASGPHNPLFIKTVDDHLLCIPKLKIGGQPLGLVHSEKALRRAKLLLKGKAIDEKSEIRMLSTRLV